MGIPVLILGASGSGKSTSMRNLDEDSYGIFNVASKMLPFRNNMKAIANGANYGTILKSLAAGHKKIYVIDDSQYLLCFEMFDKAKETGYNKFTDMALHFYQLIRYIIDKTPADCIVYFLHHCEVGADGKLKAKTIGKMLDEKLTVEGLFTIVLLADNSLGTYKFITQNDGTSVAKSPMGMFDKEIDNDLDFVDKTIRDYYNLQEVSNER